MVYGDSAVRARVWIRACVCGEAVVVSAINLRWKLTYHNFMLQHVHQLKKRHQNYFQVNTLGPRQNGHHLPDDIFKCIFLNENVWIFIKISLNFVPKGPIRNIPALVQIMAWCRPGDKPLSESMMVTLFTHICVTRPQWVNIYIAQSMPLIHTHL